MFNLTSTLDLKASTFRQTRITTYSADIQDNNVILIASQMDVCFSATLVHLHLHWYLLALRKTLDHVQCVCQPVACTSCPFTADAEDLSGVLIVLVFQDQF